MFLGVTRHTGITGRLGWIFLLDKYVEERIETKYYRLLGHGSVYSDRWYQHLGEPATIHRITSQTTIPTSFNMKDMLLLQVVLLSYEVHAWH